jgi:response regulator RpfG family c-di-GMP phosphodiesterase
LKGAYIPLGSRIIAIADTFDVLTLRSLPEPESGLDGCLSILGWYSGSHFDPELLETFSKLVPEWAGAKASKDDVDAFHSAMHLFLPTNFSGSHHEDSLEGSGV